MLTRLRHPKILKVLEPLTEDAYSLAFVTEKVAHCLGDLLKNPQDLYKIMSDVEVRLGLIDIIEALTFVHRDARMVHFAVCPENIYVTPEGK